MLLNDVIHLLRYFCFQILHLIFVSVLIILLRNALGVTHSGRMIANIAEPHPCVLFTVIEN